MLPLDPQIACVLALIPLVDRIMWQIRELFRFLLPER